MGNKSFKPSIAGDPQLPGLYTNKANNHFCNSNQNFLTSSSTGSSGRSVGSIGSGQSISRSWTKFSRKRWRGSTQTLPPSFESWPITQLESFFLPEFPLASSIQNKRQFEIVEEISKGAFGRVFKVKKADTDESYALKVLLKSKIIEENCVRQVKEEVQIQRACGHHPFIVNSSLHWQSRKRLYIISDYVPGGELLKLLKLYQLLPEVLVRLYIAQLALVLDFLHNAGVIYRDLKPENILLDKDYNLQLTDFGLSKWLSYGKKTTTICGTIHYMAPEVAKGGPYGHAADWWSLGVVACLMLTAEYPEVDHLNDDCNNEEDSGDKQMEKTKRTAVTLPLQGLKMAPRDLILRLMEFEPEKRLRSLRTLETIAFYKGFNFEDVKEKKVSPKDLLDSHFPDGPPSTENVANFDETFITSL